VAVGCGRAGGAFQVLTGCWGVRPSDGGCRDTISGGGEHAARFDVVRMQCVSTRRVWWVVRSCTLLTRSAGRSAGYGDGALTSSEGEESW
jgi:hypothetical protein